MKITISLYVVFCVLRSFVGIKYSLCHPEISLFVFYSNVLPGIPVYFIVREFPTTYYAN